jgi:hypothetical protein
MTKTTIRQDWLKCLDLCAASGRMEDYPRNLRLPKYAPSEATLAGRKFASIYRNDYGFLVERLAGGSDFEKLCAFECLEYMCWDFDIGSVPQELFDISEPLPPIIFEELAGDRNAEGFSGATIGDWFRHVFQKLLR